jgi:hypothetical protein
VTRTIATVTALALLGGCALVPFRHHNKEARQTRPAPAPTPTPTPGVVTVQPGSGACRLDTLKVLEGRPGSAVVAAQALQLSGARTIRWMHPGDAVTMDFQPDRLNIKLTRSNIVRRFACG